MRAWLAMLGLFLTAALPDLATGLRQVREGDFEGAVVTLQAVIAQLGPSGPARELSQAHLHLGIAQLALDKRDEAKARFLDALKYDPQLNLSATQYSPKVLALFAEARADRAQAQAAQARPKEGGGSSKTVLLIGGAAAVGAGVVVATRGGDGAPPAGVTELTSVRFATTTLECPNDSVGRLLSVTLLAELTNGSDSALVIGSVDVTLVITNSPGFPEEIGRPSNAPVTHSFDRLAPRQRGTLTLMTELACGNSGGDPARFNQWRGDVAINSSVGTLRGQTANQLTVNIP